MKLTLTRDLKTEILEVDKAFINSLAPWWDNIYGYLNKLEDDSTWNIIPTIVLGIYKYLGIDKYVSISMAGIFKMFYFANSIHGFIRDDREGQKHDRQLQFDILIGDYIYGCILKKLLDLDSDRFLGIFSGMMCEINEGMIVRYKLGADYHDAVKKTKAPLYATAFLTAAEFSGAKDERKNLYKQLGYNLGMSIELLNCYAFEQEAQAYIHKSCELFRYLNQKNRVANSGLERLIKELHHILCTVERAAVI